MPVTLESRVRRMQVFTLAHDIYCRATCACAELVVFVADENPGLQRGARRVTKRVPGSLTLLAFEHRANLPNRILEVPDVQKAIGRGDVRIRAHTPEPAAPAQVALPTAGAPAVPAAGSK